jgi:hypothetical protein
LRHHANVRSYGFTVFTHDPDRPWVILGSERRTIELDDHVVFSDWATNAYPRDRFTVQIDAWGDSPKLGRR